MSIFKVIGWTNYSSRKYKECIFSYSIYDAVADELYAKKYIFDGSAHQNAKWGCPVLNNGKKLCLSMRGWGGLMAEVVNRDGSNYDYMDFYMDLPREIYEDTNGNLKKLAFPTPGVNRAQISENLSKRLMDSLEVKDKTFCGIEKGEITATVTTSKYFCHKKNGDLVEFFYFEGEQAKYILTEIVSVSKFETFKDFMESDIVKKTEYASTSRDDAEVDFAEQYKYNSNPLQDVIVFEFKKFTE